jgi:hypothetical protein
VIISLVMIIQLAFVYLGGALLRTAPLLRGELLLTLALALSVIPAELLRKLILRFLNIKQRF